VILEKKQKKHSKQNYGKAQERQSLV